MPAYSILMFIAIFIFVLLVGLNIFLVINNKRIQTLTEKFIVQTNELIPTIIQNVKLRYTTTNGLRIQNAPNNRCDLVLFNNCLALVRRQDFIFKIYFDPIIITSDIAITKKIFNYLDIYKPDRITFNQLVKGEVDIKLTDPIYRHYTIDITLKGLSKEQTNQLEKIKTWC